MTVSLVAVPHSGLTDRSFEVKVAPDGNRQMLFCRPNLLATTFAAAIALGARSLSDLAKVGREMVQLSARQRSLRAIKRDVAVCVN